MKTFLIWLLGNNGKLWLDSLGRLTVVLIVGALVWAWVYQKEINAGLHIAFNLSQKQMEWVNNDDMDSLVEKVTPVAKHNKK